MPWNLILQGSFDGPPPLNYAQPRSGLMRLLNLSQCLTSLSQKQHPDLHITEGKDN